jgi:hypothetical protein
VTSEMLKGRRPLDPRMTFFLGQTSIGTPLYQVCSSHGFGPHSCLNSLLTCRRRLQILSPGSFDDALQFAVETHAACSDVDTTRRVITLPRYAGTYSTLVGRSKTETLAWITKYLPRQSVYLTAVAGICRIRWPWRSYP